MTSMVAVNEHFKRQESCVRQTCEHLFMTHAVQRWDTGHCTVESPLDRIAGSSRSWCCLKYLVLNTKSLGSRPDCNEDLLPKNIFPSTGTKARTILSWCFSNFMLNFLLLLRQMLRSFSHRTTDGNTKKCECARILLAWAGSQSTLLDSGSEVLYLGHICFI